MNFVVITRRHNQRGNISCTERRMDLFGYVCTLAAIVTILITTAQGKNLTKRQRRPVYLKVF